MNNFITTPSISVEESKEPQTKQIYHYSDKFVFSGVSTLYETGLLQGVFLLPANATFVPPPEYIYDTQNAIWSESDGKWTIKDRPTPENTPKPEIDKNLYKLEWDVKTDDWRIEVKQEIDYPPKPDYDNFSQYLDLVEGEWVIKNVIRTEENTPKPPYDDEMQTLVWDTDKWVVRDIINWNTVRIKRNNLLYLSDWRILPDVNTSNKQQWTEYRQALRDITSTYSTPEEVVWPVEPS